MEGLSTEQREEILDDWRGNLPRIDRLETSAPWGAASVYTVITS